MIFFLAIALLLAFGWWRATNRLTLFLIIAGILIAGESVLGWAGFYSVATKPPRILLLAGPPMVFMMILFSLRAGRRFIDGLDLRLLTLMHSIRVAVELVLYGLYLQKAIPVDMTFAGGNYDILSGLTAPLIYYFAFEGKVVRHRWLLVGWNLVCLALLFSVVAKGVTGLRVVGWMALLPGFIVPLVMFAHFVAIRRVLVRPVATVSLL